LHVVLAAMPHLLHGRQGVTASIPGDGCMHHFGACLCPFRAASRCGLEGCFSMPMEGRGNPDKRDK
jgi:hypothetical protein